MNEQLRKEYWSRIVEGNVPLVIPINDDNGAEIGVLRPITKMHLQSNDVIEKMTNWRNQYKTFFLTQFNATPERTRRWLEEVVLKDNTRLLFLIFTPTKLVGHYGFKKLSPDSVEIDNLIRGEVGGHPKLIYYAEISLIKWLFTTFEVKKIYGFALADNFMALNLHKSVGFRLTELVPLKRLEVRGDVHLKMDIPGDPSPDGLYSQKIELVPGNFIIHGGKL